MWATGLGVLIFFSRLGEPFAASSFDLPFRFWSPPTPDKVIVVTMDESTYSDPELNKGYEFPKFNRSTHARFLNKLAADGAPLVVFDIFFQRFHEPTSEDGDLAAAITKHGNVILTAELEKLHIPGIVGSRTNDPPFEDVLGCKIAFPDLDLGIVRSFPVERETWPSIPLAASDAYDVQADPHPPAPRWVRYYGKSESLPTISYNAAMSSATGYFKGKVVFIGGSPKIKNLGDADEFATPTDKKMRGVEIHATMFLNLIRSEFLTEMSARNQFLLIVFIGVSFGWIVTRFRPVPALLITFGVALAVSGVAIVFFWTQRIWFNWVLIGWFEIPVAWATSALMYSRRLHREKETLRRELESIKSKRPPAPGHTPLPDTTPPAAVLADLHPVPAQDAPVTIQKLRAASSHWRGRVRRGLARAQSFRHLSRNQDHLPQKFSRSAALRKRV